MTEPLRLLAGTTTLQQVATEEFARFRYNLRRRYALSLQAPRAPGKILLGSGTNFGTAANTIRTRGQSDHPVRYQPAPGTGSTTHQTFNYGLDLANVPALPTTAAHFENTYATLDEAANLFEPQMTVETIMTFLIDQCIVEMKSDDGITGDGVGTYRVQIPNPGPGWVGAGTFFRDSVYNDGSVVNHPLWLRTSVPTPPTGLINPFKVVPTGLDEMTPQEFEDFVFPLLVYRLNTAGTASTLRYNVNITAVGRPRGEFIDTRLNSTNAPVQQFINVNDYRTIREPSGSPVEFETYFLGLS